MILSEAFELYRQDVIIYEDQSSKTEESHRYALKFLIQYLDDIPIEELTFEQVRSWKVWLGHGRGDSTVREYIIRLRVVLRHLQKRGYAVLDYELVKVPKRREKVPEFLTKEQVAELIAAIVKPHCGYAKINRYRNAAIVSLFYASGIRASELINLDRGAIREDNTFTVTGKGQKVRLCFIDTRTREYLDQYLALRIDNNPALFIANQGGKRISKSTLQLIFDNVRSKVDFKVQVHPHTLRHSFATDLLRNNTNLLYVRDLLGHSSIITTQIYTHVVDEDLHQVYAEKHTV